MFGPEVDLKTVLALLEDCKDIKLPYGDNEGTDINDPENLERLQEDERDRALRADEAIRAYVRTMDGQIDNRAIGFLNKHGVETYLGPDQYDSYRMVGASIFRVWDEERREERELKFDISDRSIGHDYD